MLHLLVTAMMKNAAKYEINIRIAKLTESILIFEKKNCLPTFVKRHTGLIF